MTRRVVEKAGSSPTGAGVRSGGGEPVAERADRTSVLSLSLRAHRLTTPDLSLSDRPFLLGASTRSASAHPRAAAEQERADQLDRTRRRTRQPDRELSRVRGRSAQDHHQGHGAHQGAGRRGRLQSGQWSEC